MITSETSAKVKRVVRDRLTKQLKKNVGWNGFQNRI